MESFDLGGSRYEVKMVFENVSRYQVETWVRLHSYAFKTAYPSRQVNNIYFDTFSLDAFNDHIEGVELRRKLRFRWYGEDLTVAHGNLELKHKQGPLGWKTFHSITPALLLNENSWTDIQQILLSDTDAMFHEVLAVSQPLLINCYQRDYFISADDEVRLTLDYDLKGYDQSLSVDPNVSFQLPVRDLVVIEIKTSVANAKRLADVLTEFPLHVRAFSKYVELSSRIVEQ